MIKINLMKPTYFFFFFFMLSVSFSQQKNTVIEDDYEILKGKIRLNFNASYDRSLIYAEQMAKSSNYEHLAFANGAMSCLLQKKGETEKSNEKYKKALDYLEKMPDSKIKKRVTADVYNYKGLTEWYRGNYGVALEKFQDGIKISSQLKDVKQIIKFKSNIALINESVGNYQLSIRNSKEVLDFINKNERLFTNEELLTRKSPLYLGLGSAYESYFVDKERLEILDSVEYFYKKTIEYSEIFPYNQATAKLSLGNVYNWKGDYKNAEKTYLEVAILLKQIDSDDLAVAYYNLGDINFTAKNYKKALFFYQKSDSVALVKNVHKYTYFKSNCYQAKIYNILNMPQLAHKHSRIYLDRLDEFETKLREERLKVNYKQGKDNLTAEMLSIDKKYKEDLFLNRILNVFYIIILFGVVLILIKIIRDKNGAHKKLIDLIADSKRNN
jgi:tetratricopeptide (TPR) repeat protein